MYLSGLLIGHEVRAEASGEVVHLVGSAGLCGLYAAAIGRVGGRAEVVAGEAAAMGLAAIGEQVRWD